VRIGERLIRNIKVIYSIKSVIRLVYKNIDLLLFSFK
jgi:hypothetical protein